MRPVSRSRGCSRSPVSAQDANAISSHLHQLIEVAGVQRPFVLVGHSISGIYLRSYAARYPGDLAGLVFIDGATPLQDSRIPRALLKIQRVFGLLSRRGDAIRTTIPLLDADTTAAVRSRAAYIAAALIPALRPPIRTLHRELSRNGLQDSEYAVVFGYALDTLLWENLRTRAALPSTSLTLQQPFWRGAFWAIYPERSDAAGTNELVHGRAHLTMVWTDPVVSRLNLFAQAPTTLATLAAMERSPASSGVKNLRSTCAVAGCAGADQMLRVPSVDERAGDPMHGASAEIAGTVSRALLSSGNGNALIALVPNATREQALVIVAHELIWEVADALVKARIVSRPAVLGAAANAASLEPLLFVRFTD